MTPVAGRHPAQLQARRHEEQLERRGPRADDRTWELRETMVEARVSPKAELPSVRVCPFKQLEWPIQAT